MTPNTKIIACATVIEEMLPLIPNEMSYEVLDFGLHRTPEKLKTALQEAIDRTKSDIHTLLLGYGLCSQAVVGLRANRFRLIIPKVDDCIAIFLGSDQAYQQQSRQVPGTYYLTKGWIEAGDGPFEEFDELVNRYGEDKARWLMGQILKNYTRLALINTGQYELARYQEYARKTAQRFNLKYEEIPGSTALVKKFIQGPWDNDFVVIQPGQTVSYLDFKTNRSNP